MDLISYLLLRSSFMLETQYHTTTTLQFRNKNKFLIVHCSLTNINLSVSIQPDAKCVFKYMNNFELPVFYFSEQLKALPFLQDHHYKRRKTQTFAAQKSQVITTLITPYEEVLHCWEVTWWDYMEGQWRVQWDQTRIHSTWTFQYSLWNTKSYFHGLLCQYFVRVDVK